MFANTPPISQLLPEILNKLAEHPLLILQAPPGAGKTTCVPLALLKSDILADKSILMLEPRRLAASNAANFMATQLGQKVGHQVGYSIRYQRKVSAATRIEVVTEGILTRRLQRDPELKGVGLVIFDEFHERHLQSDLALALCLDCQHGLREDLRILIMSATLDGDSLARQLHAPILTSEGHSYPVTTCYHPGRPNETLVDTTTAAIRQALVETTGDLLVFLPGEAEIRRCAARLSNIDSALLCPLYGNLPFAEQERAIKPAEQRKIVLATNIAETSLTIEGIGVVIDSGYSRQPRFDSASGLTHLQLGRISQASAIQRSGRAGRLGPGRCYRLWSEGTQQALLPHTPAEIRNADLAPLVLDLLSWGATSPKTLFWLDPPSPSAWQSGVALLELLGVLNKQQHLNADGQKLVTLPVHPRLGKLLLIAQENDLLSLGCDLVALLSEPGQYEPSSCQSDSDILDRLEAFWAHPNTKQFSAVARASRHWQRFFKIPPEKHKNGATTEQLTLLLAAAYPDRIAKIRQHGTRRYLLSSGQGVELSHKSAVNNHEFLLAIELRRGKNKEAEITLASKIEKTTVEKISAISNWQEHCYWDKTEGRIISYEQQHLGALVINQRPCKLNRERADRAIIDAIRDEGLHILNWDSKSQNLRARLQFLHSSLPQQNWPDFSDKGLLQNLEQWLLPFVNTSRNLAELQKINLPEAFRSRLDWSQRQNLDRLAPERLEVASGSQIRIEYTLGENPTLAVKLQEMFGTTETPRIAAGQIPVVIHLLSPAGRPLQITQDLRHFWEQSYPEVQKEMKGRYPKHPWPDDPLRAIPTKKTKRKLEQQEKK